MNIDLTGLSLFGKFMAQNQRYLQQPQPKQVRNEAVIKEVYTKDSVKMIVPPGILLPDVLRGQRAKEYEALQEQMRKR